MSEKSSYKQQITSKVTYCTRRILRISSTQNISDLVINKYPYILDSDKIHMILACIADDTGISMITLRNYFPYDRYFITTKADMFVQFGIFFLLFTCITFFISKEIVIYPFLLLLSFILFLIALLNYLNTCFIRNRKPTLTVTLFIEIIASIIDKHCDELFHGVTVQERRMWRKKIYEVFTRYLHIFMAKEFSPGLVVPLSDPDEYDMGAVIEECGELFSLSFETIDQSGIYNKYLEFDDDQLLTVVHFADLLINFWAENQLKMQKATFPDLPQNSIK